MYILFSIIFFIGTLVGAWLKSTELAFWCAASLFFVVLYATKRSTKLGWLSVSSISMLGFLVYSLAVPLHHLVYNDYDDASIRYAIVLCSIGAIGFIIGLHLSKQLEWKRKVLLNNFESPSESIRIGQYIMVFGVIAAFLAVAITVGFQAYFEAGYAGRALLKREAGPVELGLYYAIIGYLFIFYGWLNDDKARGVMLLVLAFPILFVSYVSFLGIRRPSFFLVLSMIVLYAIFKSKNIRLYHVLIALISFFLFGLFASFRQVLSDQGVEAAIFFVIENFTFAWFDFSVTELGAPFRALLDVVELWADEPLRLGTSYLIAPINLIPSFIFSPFQSLSVEYTNRVFSSEYIAIGGNMGFFAVAEGYINFSYFGVFVEFILIGWIIGVLERRVIRMPTARTVIAYCLTAPWFFFFLRTDVASFVKVVFYSVLPAFILHFIMSKFKLRAARRA